jgi:hypothetical protein
MIREELEVEAQGDLEPQALLLIKAVFKDSTFLDH